MKTTIKVNCVRWMPFHSIIRGTRRVRLLSSWPVSLKQAIESIRTNRGESRLIEDYRGLSSESTSLSSESTGLSTESTGLSRKSITNRLKLIDLANRQLIEAKLCFFKKSNRVDSLDKLSIRTNRLFLSRERIIDELSKRKSIDFILNCGDFRSICWHKH